MVVCERARDRRTNVTATGTRRGDGTKKDGRGGLDQGQLVLAAVNCCVLCAMLSWETGGVCCSQATQQPTARELSDSETQIDSKKKRFRK